MQPTTLNSTLAALPLPSAAPPQSTGREPRRVEPAEPGPDQQASRNVSRDYDPPVLQLVRRSVEDYEQMLSSLDGAAPATSAGVDTYA